MATFIKSLFSFKEKPTTSSDLSSTTTSSTTSLESSKKKSLFFGKSKSKPTIEKVKSQLGVPDSTEYPHRVVVVDDYNISTYFFKTPEAVGQDLLGQTDDFESYYSLMTTPVNAGKNGTLKGIASYGGRGSSRSLIMELSQNPAGLYLQMNSGGYSSLNFVVTNMDTPIPIVIASDSFGSLDELKTAMTTVVDVGPAPVIDKTDEANWTAEQKEANKKIMDEYKTKESNAKYRQSSLEYVYKPLVDKLDKFKKDGETVNVKFINPDRNPEEVDDAKKWMATLVSAK